jgi:hypothetical protein
VVVPAYTLALDELNAIAAGAGLSWVNSDAEKVRVVQEAIAAEPKPVHVPRERPPVVVLDEGPLVLVETRKDLSQVTLPFDAPRSPDRRAPHEKRPRGAVFHGGSRRGSGRRWPPRPTVPSARADR